MAGIADLFYMGQPNPATQIAAALGNGPTGHPNPMVAGAGGPSATGAAPGAPTAGAAPPQPQAYTSPPELSNAYSRLADPNQLMGLYLQLSQRQQAQEGINRGIGMMLAGLAQPRDRAIMVNASQGMVPDAGAQMGDLMKIYSFDYQLQRQRALERAAPQLAAQTGIPVDAIMADPEIVKSIAVAQAGLSGDPTVQAQTRDRNQWLKQNAELDASGNVKRDASGTPILKSGAVMPEKFTNIETYKADVGATAAEAHQRTLDLEAGAKAFPEAHADYQQTEDILKWLKEHPEATAAAVHEGSWATGRLGQLRANLGNLPPDTAAAAGYLAQLQGKLYGEGWKGRGGRLSQLEAGKISEGFSQFNNPALPDEQITQQVSNLYDRTRKAHSNIFGIGGAATPSEYYGIMDPQYKPGGKFYNGATDAGGGGSDTASSGKQLSADELQQAKDLIARDGREAVIAHLKAKGYDTSGL